MKEDQERTPLRTILQNFLNHIESLEIQRAEDSYEKEFQELKFFSEILKTSKQYSCSEGEKEVNRKKNRYKDILPFDNSRVILSEYAGVPGSDYINANYIKGASGSPAYIACQGPLPHTVNDFWRMVVECEVQVIVMACNEEEAGKHKCENYWVEREGEEKQFGMVAIRLVKASTVCPDFLVRTMRLKYTTSQSPHISEERTVCQFHYSAWPDHGVPPLVRPLLDMVRLVRDTQASETLPVLVHCSAGCGRTGTICAIDYVWGLLRAGKLSKDFSLYKLVQDMRKQRIAMVQTKEQYVLVHQAVRELFREQLRMIDSHPYENIDANGMPLVKEDQEPTYASPTISIRVENSNEEKQDGKEKELEVKIPPLPQKRRLHVASSKQEKEVENLTEKQRSIVEQSSASHKPRIAKLKALFERSPGGMRESRSSQAKQRSSPLVARSHSLGAMRIKADCQDEQLVMAEGNSVCPVPCQAATAAASVVVHTPQLGAVQTSALTVRPCLPVKRSKSLKVLGSNHRCKLSVVATINSITPINMSDDCSDSQATSSIPVENVQLQKEEGATNTKPFIPPKKYMARSKEVTVKIVERNNAKSSKKNELFKSQKSLDWMNYDNSHMVPKRRRSLESVNFENAAILDESSCESHNLVSPSQKSETLEEEARRILQDCRDYLVSDEKHRVSQDQVAQPSPSADTLTLEAQRKVNAIIAGLGVRERRNSFRQAVGTGQEGDGKPSRKFKDYEAIWPCGSAVAVSTNATNVQIQDSHCSSSYVNILTDSISNAPGQVHQCKGKVSTCFPKTDQRKQVPTTSISVKSQMSSLEPEQIAGHYVAAASSNVRIGKLGIHPKQLSRIKSGTPERKLTHSSQTGTEQTSSVLSAQAGIPSNLMQSSRCEMTPKSSSLWLRKTKSSGPGLVDFRSHLRKEGGFYNVTEQELASPWIGKTTIAHKVQTREIPFKCSGPLACHRKAPVPNHEHVLNSKISASTQVTYKPSLSQGSAVDATATSTPLITVQVKKPSSSQEISYGLVAGVQLRRGSRDDLALCPSPTGGNGIGPHAPTRVRRHASVVLLRRSLAETDGKMNAGLPHPSLTIWNSPTSGNGDKSTVHVNHHDQDGKSCDKDASSNGSWQLAPGVDVDTVAASIVPQQGDQSSSNLSRALENLHVRKSPHHKSNSMSNIQSTLSNGFTSQQLSQPTGTGKKQHYF